MSSKLRKLRYIGENGQERNENKRKEKAFVSHKLIFDLPIDLIIYI
jgi:hypothetical protein